MVVVTKTLMKQLGQIQHRDPKVAAKRRVAWAVHYDERRKAIEAGPEALKAFDRAFAGKKLW